MVKTQPRASVTFSEQLNAKIDAECKRTKLSKNKLITKIIEEYFENKQSGVSEQSPKYTAEQFKEAETDSALRAKILSNAPDQFIRLMFAEIQEEKRQKKEQKL